jgi:photosystem II stability/assembly factor-like uncharacterized protein
MKTFQYFSFAILLSLSFLLKNGCEEVTIPDSDSSPPSITMAVFVNGEQIDLTPGSEDVFRTLDPDDAISIIATARDENGGVKSVSISGGVTVSCTDGQYGQNHQSTILLDNSDTGNEPGDMANVSRILAETFYMEEFEEGCGPMYWLTSIQGSLAATGENFHGGTSQTARFEFEVEANTNWGSLSFFQPDVEEGGRAVAITVHPSNEQRMIVASETGGLFQTTDGGAYWTRLEGLQKIQVFDVKYAPQNGNIVIAAAREDFNLLQKGCIWRSTDGGMTWSAPEGALPPSGQRCGTEVSAYSVSFESGTNRVYVATDCGVAISDDLGVSWRHVVPNPNTAIAADKMQDRVWSVLAQEGGQLNIAAVNGIYASLDRGEHWQRGETQPVAGGWGTNHAFAASPYNPEHLFLAGGNQGLYLSTDAGVNWEPVLGFPRSNVFARGENGHLYRHHWNGHSWLWKDQGTPENSSVAWDPAGTHYDGRIYVFVSGADGNLHINYTYGRDWVWGNHGKPEGTTVTMEPSVVTYMEGYGQKIYAFVLGDDGNLYVHYRSGDNWYWANQGRPEGGAITSAPNAITYRENGVQHIMVFVQGVDGHLHANHWDGTHWSWIDHGRMENSYVASAPTAITYHDNQRRIYVFVKGLYGNLFVRYWNGSNWNWGNQGKPNGAVVVERPNAITYFDGSGHRIYVFVKSNDMRLFVNYRYGGGGWHWAEQGAPSNSVHVASSPGTTCYMEGSDRIYSFVRGSDDHLYVNYWNGSQWQWAHQGQSNGVDIAGSPVAFTQQYLWPRNRPVFVKSATSISENQDWFDIYFGNGVNLWRQAFLQTEDGPIPKTQWVQLAVDHPDPADVAFSNDGINPILLATDGGLHKTTDQGFSWALAGSNEKGYSALQITEITGQKVLGNNPHVDLYYGTQDNGIKGSSDGGVTWPYHVCCEGFFLRTDRESYNHAGTKVTGVACGPCGNFITDQHFTNGKYFPSPPDGDDRNDEPEGNPIYLKPGHYLQRAINNTEGVPYTHTYYLTRDHGQNWEAVFNIDERPWEMPRVVGTADNPILYQAVIRPGTNADGNTRIGLKKITDIYGDPVVSDADGVGFGSLGIFPTMFAWYVPFAVSPVDPYFIIMADVDSDEMKYSEDGGLTWQVDEELTELLTSDGKYKFQNGQFTLVDHIAFDPEQPNHILVGTSQKRNLPVSR